MADIGKYFSLHGQVAVITGASSGLGVTFAKALAEAGADVVLMARRRDRLQALAADIEASGRRALVIECDVVDEAGVEAAAQQTLATFGRVDVLVNNAGISQAMAAEDESGAQFRRVLDVNLTGVFLCARAFGKPMLAAGRGRIINIASMLGLVASAPVNQASYVAAKAGVVNLTRELAAQWARRGVRVNALAPGYFPSEMAAEMFEDEKSISFVRRRTSLGRGGDPQELIAPLLLLASESNGYMTGHTLVVDGGWTIT